MEARKLLCLRGKGANADSSAESEHQQPHDSAQGEH